MFELMLLQRLELEAEKLKIVSKTQFGFRKGKRTTDCLAVLTTKAKTTVHLMDVWELVRNDYF
jgi:hypothetical protein